MQAIQALLTGVCDMFITAWEFVLTFFRDFIQFLELLVKMPAILSEVLSWIPGELWVSLAVLFTVVILYKVLGREG